MLGTRLLLESHLTSPLGHLTLAGTGSGRSRIRGRVLRNYAWVYVVSGDATYRDELGSAQRLCPGDAVMIFPGVQHAYGPVPGSAWEEIYFTFDGPLFGLLESSGLVERTAPVTHLEPVAEWAERYLAFADRPRPASEAEAMILAGEFMQLLVASLARSPRPQSWLGRARALLDADIAEPMDLDATAAEFGLSAETFRKRFRREAGEPPARYRDRRRVATAGELLAATSLGLRQIADMLGYSDEFHLSKRFRAVTGHSPREFRSTRTTG